MTDCCSNSSMHTAPATACVRHALSSTFEHIKACQVTHMCICPPPPCHKASGPFLTAWEHRTPPSSPPWWKLQGGRNARTSAASLKNSQVLSNFVTKPIMPGAHMTPAPIPHQNMACCCDSSPSKAEHMCPLGAEPIGSKTLPQPTCLCAHLLTGNPDQPQTPHL